MFNKKELSDLQQQMSGLQNGMQEITTVISGLQDTFQEKIKVFDEMHQSLNKLRTDQQQVMQEMHIHVQQLQINREVFEKEIRRLQHTHQLLSKDLFTDVQQQLQHELSEIQKQSIQYTETKKTFLETMDLMSTFITEVQKFKEISQSIKKQDFTLTNYTRQLANMDNEKLHLLKKIDGLQRLVASERRKK